MRQTVAGAGSLLLGVALAATVTGGVLLAVVWILVAVIGLALLVTSDPVRDRVPWIPRGDRPELKLTVRPNDETWHVFAPDIYMLAVKVRLKNRTRQRKGLHTFGFASTGLRNSTATAPALHAVEVSREKDRRQKELGPLPSHVEPRKTIEFWFVAPTARSAEGGTPGYEIGVRDEKNNDYLVTREPEEGKQHVWGSSLTQYQ